MKVVNRNGKTEEISFDEIKNRIRKLINLRCLSFLQKFNSKIRLLNEQVLLRPEVEFDDVP